MSMATRKLREHELELGRLKEEEEGEKRQSIALKAAAKNISKSKTNRVEDLVKLHFPCQVSFRVISSIKFRNYNLLPHLISSRCVVPELLSSLALSWPKIMLILIIIPPKHVVPKCLMSLASPWPKNMCRFIIMRRMV